MNISGMDRKIRVERVIETVDTLGDVRETWSTLMTIFAETRYLKGTEAEEARQLHTETDTKFVIRWSTESAGIRTKDRIVLDSTQYNILSVVPMPGGRPVMIELLTKLIGPLPGFLILEDGTKLLVQTGEPLII